MCRQINNEELDRVVGGITRTVDTNTSIDAVVRGGPGMQYGQIASLKDHTEVNTTGYSSYNQLDGKPGMRSTIRYMDGWRGICWAIVDG